MGPISYYMGPVLYFGNIFGGDHDNHHGYFLSDPSPIIGYACQ